MKILRLLFLVLTVVAMGAPGHVRAYQFSGGDPVNYFDPDGRLAKGWMEGWKENQSNPANSSWAFNLGNAIGNLQAGYYEGFGGGASIVADTATAYQIDSLHAYTGTLQGPEYTASRISAGIGVGAAALASGAALLEIPSVYVGATTVAYSPWTPVAVGGAMAGGYAYGQGGSAGDVALAAVAGGTMTYMAAPFPMGGQNVPPRVTAPSSPTFIGQQSGPAIIVPAGAAGPTPVINPQGRTTGFAFTGGAGGYGLAPQVNTVRIMDATPPRGASPGYPNGYATYGIGRQGVNPYTGQPIPNSDPWRHIPLAPAVPPGSGQNP